MGLFGTMLNNGINGYLQCGSSSDIGRPETPPWLFSRVCGMIYKDTPGARIENGCREGAGFPRVVTHAVQGKGWMDNATFSKWVKQVLKPYHQGKPRCLMVLDSVSAHKSVQSKSVLEEANLELSIIPGEYTAVFQALDAGIMKASKTYYEELWQNLLVDHPNGKVKARLLLWAFGSPSLSVLRSWIANVGSLLQRKETRRHYLWFYTFMVEKIQLW